MYVFAQYQLRELLPGFPESERIGFMEQTKTDREIKSP